MEIFARDMLLMGPPRDVRSWTVNIAQLFGEATGTTPHVWTSLAGGRTGHYTWTMGVDGSAGIMQMMTDVFDDDAYMRMIEDGREFFTGPAHDTVYRTYGPVPEDTSEPGHVASLTTAVARAGNLGHAVGWGMEAAEHVRQLTGLPVLMLGNMLGKFSTLTWMGVAPSAAEADAANRAMNADDGYRKLIARGGEDFVDGSARTQFFLRIS